MLNSTVKLRINQLLSYLNNQSYDQEIVRSGVTVALHSRSLLVTRVGEILTRFRNIISMRYIDYELTVMLGCCRMRPDVMTKLSWNAICSENVTSRRGTTLQTSFGDRGHYSIDGQRSKQPTTARYELKSMRWINLRIAHHHSTRPTFFSPRCCGFPVSRVDANRKTVI